MGLGDEAFARRDMCEDAAHGLWACSDYAILHKGPYLALLNWSSADGLMLYNLTK